jgi:hypothetical protein
MIDTIIDISHHNGLHLDFGAAAGAGIEGVIQKARKASQA